MVRTKTMDNNAKTEYENLLGFANELPTVALDIGNLTGKLETDTPIMSGSKSFKQTVIDHALVEIDEVAYRDRLYYHEDNFAPHLIEWRGRFFVAGAEAYSVNTGLQPIRGRAKYTRDYYGILAVHGLLKLFDGNIPEAFNVFLAHPPGDKDFVDLLKRAVHGRWKVRTNTGAHEFEIVYSNTFDEIIGGVHNVTDGVDGEYIESNPMEGCGPALVFDLGGGTLDMLYLKADLSVDYDRQMGTYRIGVNRAIENFKRMFDAKYQSRLTTAEDGVGRAEILDAFRSETHVIYDAGESLDCSKMYTDAFTPIIREVREAVRDYTGGRFTGLKSALLTGGGSSIVLPRLKEDVFPQFAKNNAIRTSDKPERMITANVSGGMKIVAAMKAVARIRADRWLREQGYGR